MTRTLTAIALAATLALPAAPMRAQQIDAGQAAQILGGLLALYGVKEALDDRDDRDEARDKARDDDRRAEELRERAREARRRAAEARDRRDRPGWPGPRRHARDRDDRHGHDWDRRRFDPDRDRYDPVGDRLRVAPDACVLAFEGSQGPSLGYARHCIERSVLRFDLLPRGCLREVETLYGPQSVYDRRCLGLEGWDINERR